MIGPSYVQTTLVYSSLSFTEKAHPFLFVDSLIVQRKFAVSMAAASCRRDPLPFKRRSRLKRNFFSGNRACEYDVVVSIDFGTSFSGFAYSFNHEDGSEDIYMNLAWGSAQGSSTLKTPTCLLLDPEKKFVTFGYEAADKYAELEDAQDRSYYFFDRFKMLLHGSEVSLCLSRIFGLVISWISNYLIIQIVFKTS